MRRPLAVLITGASSGIGLALARQYAASGARLMLVGRRQPASLAADLVQGANYCPIDLARPDAVGLIADWLSDRQIDRLDRLVLNAGIGWYGPIAAQSPTSIADLLTVNLYAPIALTHALLPRLTAASGRIALIGSLAAALPVPEYAVYGATKAALEGFGRSLRVELRGRVGVQVIHPGPTRTAMHARSGVPAERLGRQLAEPEAVAAAIQRAVERGRPAVVTIGLGPALLRLAGRRLAPLVDRLARGR